MVTQSMQTVIYSTTIILTLLIGLLCWEYYQLRAHTDSLQRIYNQYALYLNTLKQTFSKRKAEVILPQDWHNQPSLVEKQELIEVPSETHFEQSFVSSDDKNDKKPHRDSLTGIVFELPIERSKFWVSSLFGTRKRPNGTREFHNGLDMAACRGTLVSSAAAGVVEQAEYVSGYGNTVLIGHDAVYKTRYAHLDSVTVGVGDQLKQGDALGTVGDTGFTRKTGKDASHLHFEVYEEGKKINPAHLLTL